MDKVAILGVGLYTSGGETLDETWQFLQDGRTSVSTLPDRIRLLVKSDVGHRIVTVEDGPYRLLRIAEKAARQALGAMDLIPDALVIGSTTASFPEVEAGDYYTHPSYLVKTLAGVLHIENYYQISQACASSGHAIAMGVDMIRQGRAETVLVGGADELTCSAIAAFEAVNLYTPVCRPFDVDRKGVTLGEAGAFLLLAKEGIGQPLAYVTGVGLTCDAFSSVAPSQSGIERAIDYALQDAISLGIAINYVIAHGTGTKLNDQVEAAAIRAQCFHPFVSSYKGSLGHPQGASGAVGATLGVAALSKREIFPTVGMLIKDPALDIAVADGDSIRLGLSNVLVLSYGSWGTNAALVLEAI